MHQIEIKAAKAQLLEMEKVIVEAQRHRRLEILCRYGDYMAERLGIIRQHVNENYLEAKHRHELSEYWTETSDILKAEEMQSCTPCHDLLRSAAKSLGWKSQTTIFMVHEYAKRNNLMHAELYEFIKERDWQAIGDRCTMDTQRLRELYVNSDTSSNDGISNWVQVIEDFRDRWISRSDKESPWGARAIITEAIDAGVEEYASLNKLAMLGDDATLAVRRKAIQSMKKEIDLKESHRKNAQKQANTEMQTENKPLESENKILKNLLGEEASEDFFTRLEKEAKKSNELESENNRLKNRTKQLETREAELKKKLRAKCIIEKPMT